MAEMIMPLLRTVFLPQGSPGIGAVNEIKADIRNAEISAEDGKIYCVGEADLLIDYISFAGENIQGETGYMIGSGKQWQALLSMPFELMEPGSMLCTDTAMVEVVGLEWFMVGSRALEMEMELKISYEDGQNPVVSAIADEVHSKFDSGTIIRRTTHDPAIPDIRLPAWTMITIDEQDVRPVLSPAVKEKMPREGWTVVEFTKPEQANDTENELVEVQDKMDQPAAETMISHEENVPKREQKISAESINVQVRELIGDAAAEEIPTFVFDFRSRNAEAVHIDAVPQSEVVEEKQNIVDAAAPVAEIVSLKEQAQQICCVEMESASEESVIAAQNIEIDRNLADKPSKTEKLMNVVETVGETVVNIADVVVDLADAFSETVAEAAAVAEIIETVADAVSGTDGGKGGLGANAVMAAAAVLSAADILPLGEDENNEVEPDVIELKEEIDYDTPLVASEPQPRVKKRKRRGVSGIPTFEINEDPHIMQNAYDIAIKK